MTALRSFPTRIMHTALAVAVLHQLIVSLLMVPPKPSGATENFAFELHEAVGLASMGILALFWTWIMLRKHENSPAALIPWFSQKRRRALYWDVRLHIKRLAHLQIPDPTSETPLASSVHGLGILSATAMAVSGGTVYMTMQPDGSIAYPGRIALDVHQAFAILTWVYLIAHAGISIAHEILGHRVLKRIFLGTK